MDDEPKPRESRREEIGQRLDVIHARIEELEAERQADAALAPFSERLVSVLRHVLACHHLRWVERRSAP